MKIAYKSLNTKFRAVLFYLPLLTFYFSLFAFADAKVYVDITSPTVKKMLIAIFDFEGPSGDKIAGIIRDDLSFTGLFTYVDKTSYVETLSQPFKPKNWTPLGIDAVVKGRVTEDKNLAVTVTLYDTFEGKGIFSKQYVAAKDLQRQLAHSIANDIYSSLTGKAAPFRTKIAFVGEDGGEKGIYIMDWDGHRMTKLGPKGNLALTPHWSSDGTRLIYSSERGRQWGIYLLNFRKMTEKRLFVSGGINMAGDFFPDGNSFIFSSSKDGTPDLYEFTIADNTVKKITSTHGIEVSPSISEDGKYIAFVSDRGGSPQIYVMLSDGGDARRITFEGSYNTSPHWSPSGNRIVFSGRRGSKNQIFTVKPDGSQLAQLTDVGNNEDPSFSPDGRYITFCSDRDMTKGVYIMRANGEGQKRITPRELKAFGPAWSPN